MPRISKKSTNKKTTSKKTADKDSAKRKASSATSKQIAGGGVNTGVISRQASTFKVTGLVRSANGALTANVIVRAFDKDLRLEQMLGESTTNNDGRYEISYTSESFARAEKKSADLIVRAYPNDQPPPKTSRPIATSPIIFNARAEEAVDLMVGNVTFRGPSEFEQIAAELKLLLEGAPGTPAVNPADLNDDDVAFLTGETGLNAQNIDFYALAAKHGNKTGVAAEVFYGLVRGSLPTDLGVLLAQNKQSLRRALEDAIRDNIIPDTFKNSIDQILKQLQEAAAKVAFESPSAPGHIPRGVLLRTSEISDDKLTQFLKLQIEHEGSQEDFWKKLRADQSFATLVDDLEFTLKLGPLTQEHLPMVSEIQRMKRDKEIKILSGLAKFDVNDWKQVINRRVGKTVISYPPNTRGNSNDEKVENYAKSLVRYFEDNFPTEVIAGRFAKDNLPGKDEVVAFFEANPTFDLRKSKVEAHLNQPNARIKNREAVAAKVNGMQRLFKLTPRYSEMRPLMVDGVDSAHAIARMGKSAFVAKYGEAMGGAGCARTVFGKAAQVTATTLHLLANYSTSFNKLDINVLLPAKTAEDAVLKVMPDWQSLFGSVDMCACEHCRSVYSPAAYLVDVLSFLEHRKLKQIGQNNNVSLTPANEVLSDRRPDISYILLDCENTNTSLPYIDLVNEVLENSVSPGTALPLIDRQTRGTAQDLSVNPQHLNIGAYDKLKLEVFPWSLPFDLWVEEARIFLKHLGVERHELMRAFQQRGTQNDPSDVAIAAEYMGVNHAEMQIITGQSTTPLILFFGYPLTVNINLAFSELIKVPVLLEKTGLSYAELTSLLKCKWINHNNAVIEFESDNLCDTDKQKIPKLDIARVHRFVRLWRKLGWTMSELDQAFSTFTPPSMDKTVIFGGTKLKDEEIKQNEEFLIQLAHVKQLCEKLNVSVATVLGWYTTINTTAYVDQSAASIKSLYEQLFQNPAVIKLNKNETDNFKLNTNRTELAATGTKLSDPEIFAALRGAFRVSDADLSLLIKTVAISSNSEVYLTLENLSRFYRRVILARALKLSVTDLLRIITLTGINPIVDDSAQVSVTNTALTLRLVEAVEKLRFSGWSPSDLFYLLRHEEVGGSTIVPSQKQIALVLDDLRKGLRQIAEECAIPPTGAPSQVVDDLLRKRLSLMLESKDVDKAMGLLSGTWKADLPTQEKFYNDHLARFMGSGASGSKKGGAFVIPKKEFLLEQVSKHLQQTRSENLVKQQLAEALTVEAETAALLLTKYVISPVDSTTPSIQVFLADPFINSDPKVVLTPAAFPDQFRTYLLLCKIAAVVTRFQVSAAQLEWLFTYGPANGCLDLNTLPVPATVVSNPPDISVGIDTQIIDAKIVPSSSPFVSVFTKWERLVDLFALRDSFEDGENVLSEIFKLSRKNGIQPDELLPKLRQLTGWTLSDIKYLSETTGFNLAFPTAYQDERALIRLRDAFTIIKRLGVSAQQCRALAKPDLTHLDARSIKQAAKGKYDDKQWIAVAKPLRNKLRERQRDALVSYLLTHPDKSRGQDWKDLEGMYAYFLIDVEMSSCQMTSRIKQAISSTQLFVQRCLMNLEEDGISGDTDDWQEWEWMKNYRVWEANRKVFLYPENWIEPELRDDKSEFFKELEDELLQNEVTEETVETALRHYLEKLDSVSRLEICGMYHEEETDDDGNKTVDILHVFGRTKGTPHIYYYRRRVDASYWTPWERVDLDIDGDNLVPVVWNRRLRLLWLILAEKNGKNENDPQWEIKIAWSEYKTNGWSAKRISSQSFLEKADLHKSQGFYLKAIGLSNNDGGLLVRIYGNIISLNKKIEIDAKSLWFDTEINIQGRVRITYEKGYWRTLKNFPDADGRGYYFWPPFDNSLLKEAPWGSLIGKVNNNEPFLINNHIENNFGTGRLYLSINDLTYNSAFSDNEGKLTVNITEISDPWPLVDFLFSECVGEPIVINHAANSLSPLVLPKRTRRIYQEFREDAADRDYFLCLVEGNFPSSIDQAVDYQTLVNAKKDVFLLNKTPGLYSLLGPHQDSQFASQRPLFFQDEKKIFFVVPSDGNQSGGNANTPKNYRFHTFYHPYLCLFIRELNRHGIDALFERRLQTTPQQYLNTQQPFDFNGTYQPNHIVLQPYPVEDVDFTFGSSYSLYNWELFINVPLLIANRLSQNQQFEDAQKWFHYIFDPTDTSEYPIPQRYWNIKPFFEQTQQAYQQQIQNLMVLLAQGGSSQEVDDLINQITQWRKHPFKPHLIARMRDTVYQKNVVMKYLDNLIAWGDQLFRRDTIESINEATQLYLMASEILGRRPELVKSPVSPQPATYNDLKLKLDDFSNALVQVENSLPDQASYNTIAIGKVVPISTASALYFCIPRNDKLLGYWDTIADRLYKIRNCMNIEGVVRQLLLFEPPIDPALLVKATAAGVDIGSVLNDINAPLPHYRFNVMSQKASELCNEVKSLGAALLSAFEKRDAEALALLRSVHEINVLIAARQIRKQQIDEARETLEGLRKSRDVVSIRHDFYTNIEFMNAGETVHLVSGAASLELQAAQLGIEMAANMMYGFPDIKVGLPTTAGATYGGSNLGNAMRAFSGYMGSLAGILNATGSMSATLGSYERRWEEWKLQEKMAAKELEQIDKQIIAAEIRLDMAERELQNHDLQVENAKEVDEFMRSKFSNRDLYVWMSSKISNIYFQSYQLAYDIAKRAERAYQYELGLEDSEFIKFDYWDSLKKGLLSGERLYHDIKRMETSYLDLHKREYEITKHISLALNDPINLIGLKENGQCEIELPELLFDSDYPGKYFRRLKSVSLTIPCVVGPYTSINCTLTLLNSRIRKNASAGGVYPENTTAEDPRFIYNFASTQSIATSSAQNDSGLFELNFRDERYLPFEGAGAISRWRIELPRETNAFDFDTISDVVLHLKYTARDGGQTLKEAALKSPTSGILLLSLRHEFPSEWHRFMASTDPHKQDFSLTKEHFPFLFRNKTINIDTIDKNNDVFAAPKEVGTSPFTVTSPSSVPGTLKLVADKPGFANVKDKLEDLLLVVRYKT